MITEKEVAMLYDTLLISPGMNDNVKTELRSTRRNILLLAKVIEHGLQTKKGEPVHGLLKAAGDCAEDEIRKVAFELLQKAGLSEMYEKLQVFEPETAKNG